MDYVAEMKDGAFKLNVTKGVDTSRVLFTFYKKDEKFFVFSISKADLKQLGILFS